MRSEPMVKWTCDRCGAEATVDEGETPDWWVVITVKGLRNPGAQIYEGEWCGECKVEHIDVPEKILHVPYVPKEAVDNPRYGLVARKDPRDDLIIRTGP